MLTVEVWIVADYKAVKAGEIRWDGKHLSASDNSNRLHNMMREPIRIDGREILPHKEPELFMRSLWRHYDGSYMWAMGAEEF